LRIDTVPKARRTTGKFNEINYRPKKRGENARTAPIKQQAVSELGFNNKF